jgi:SAM-dependent methyltransferase
MKMLRAFGKAVRIDLQGAVRAAQRFPSFISEFHRFSRDRNLLGNTWPTEPSFPCLRDADEQGGTASGHYFHQDLHVAQRIFALKPDRHIDVGSRVDGFVAHVASFRNIDVLDIRPIAANGVPEIRFMQADLMQLPEDFRASSDSVSCLHALEHFGLGRYGDPIDPDGYVKGFRSLVAMLKPDGRLHLSVPVGRQRIEFNAHRIFDPMTILDLATPNLECVMFSVVDDEGDLHRDIGLQVDTLRTVARMHYGCGIFEFALSSTK